MNKISSLLLLTCLIVSCKPKVQNKDYQDTWTEIKKAGSAYQLVDCGYSGESIKVSGDSIIHHGIMEDYAFKIDHMVQENEETILFSSKDDKAYYKFSWVNKAAGIARWAMQGGDATVIKYFVSQSQLKHIKRVKGTNVDCLTSADVGDVVNDSLAIGDGTKILTVEDENCVTLRDKKEKVLLERCFEGNILRINHKKGNFLSLTFINGKRSMDVDFYSTGNDWVSKTATYYRPSSKGELKMVQTLTVAIRDFDFEAIASRFDRLDEGMPDTVAHAAADSVESF